MSPLIIDEGTARVLYFVIISGHNSAIYHLRRYGNANDFAQ
jgi:hypothetical protein